MARAGFWAVGGYKISFRRDGRWYADDEVIENERIALLFSQHIRRGEGQEWVVDLGIDCQPVVVEDTPLVVVEATVVDSGQGRVSVDVRCNDDVTQALDPRTLLIGGDDVLYCNVDRAERGSMRARFQRPPYYTLAILFEVQGAGFALRLGAKTYPVATEN